MSDETRPSRGRELLFGKFLPCAALAALMFYLVTAGGGPRWAAAAFAWLMYDSNLNHLYEMDSRTRDA